MLGDDQRAGSEQAGRSSAEQVQRSRVLLRGVVGRIEKDYFVASLCFVAFLFFIAFRLWTGIGGAAHKSCHAAGMDAEARGQPQFCQVGAQNLERCGGTLDECHDCGSAAEGFDANRAGAGIQIQKSRAFNAGREHVEEGFAQAVTGGPCGQARRGLQRARTQRSGNDAHREPAYRKHNGAATYYNLCMRGWTIPLGRWMGVELRVHAFFPLLAVVCLGISASDGLARGLGIFLVLVAAVLVRETARLLVAAWRGWRLRAILLLPIGGLFAYADPESQENANGGGGQFAMALAGPLANGATALMLAAAFLGASGDIRLFDQPFITSAYLLRSMVWMQAGMGLLHLLPAYPLDFGRLIRGNFARKHGFAPAGRAAAGLGQVLALATMVGGMLLHNPWLIIAGFFIMIGAQVEDQGVFFQSVVDTVHMREVMLTDFATLSPSDTLADALVRCVHSLQEDFPVVRGPQLVGIVSRQRIVDALRNDGNGYVQSVMSRAFQVAQPEDTLGTTIRRLTAGHGLPLIPVTDSGRVVGIVSVQNLMSSMSLLAEQRRQERHEAGD